MWYNRVDSAGIARLRYVGDNATFNRIERKKGRDNMKILLIRHGEPDYARDSLTPRGWREAEILADRLCASPADAYYVSPLGRARDTARATLTRLNREAAVLPWLQEFRGTILNPMTGDDRIIWDLLPQYWTRCPEFFDRDHWLDNPLIRTGKSDTVYRETVEGLDALLASYGYERDGMIYRTAQNRRETIALFCHFGISCMILSHLLGVSPMILLHGFIMPPTSITTLVTEERVKGEVWFRCTGMGDASLLINAGEIVSRSGQFGETFEEGYSKVPLIQM